MQIWARKMFDWFPVRISWLVMAILNKLLKNGYSVGFQTVYNLSFTLERGLDTGHGQHSDLSEVECELWIWSTYYYWAIHMHLHSFSTTYRAHIFNGYSQMNFFPTRKSWIWWKKKQKHYSPNVTFMYFSWIYRGFFEKSKKNTCLSIQNVTNKKTTEYWIGYTLHK